MAVNILESKEVKRKGKRARRRPRCGTPQQLGRCEVTGVPGSARGPSLYTAAVAKEAVRCSASAFVPDQKATNISSKENKIATLPPISEFYRSCYTLHPSHVY